MNIRHILFAFWILLVEKVSQPKGDPLGNFAAAGSFAALAPTPGFVFPGLGAQSPLQQRPSQPYPNGALVQRPRPPLIASMPLRMPPGINGNFGPVYRPVPLPQPPMNGLQPVILPPPAPTVLSNPQLTMVIYRQKAIAEAGQLLKQNKETLMALGDVMGQMTGQINFFLCPLVLNEASSIIKVVVNEAAVLSCLTPSTCFAINGMGVTACPRVPSSCPLIYRLSRLCPLLAPVPQPPVPHQQIPQEVNGKHPNVIPNGYRPPGTNGHNSLYNNGLTRPSSGQRPDPPQQDNDNGHSKPEGQRPDPPASELDLSIESLKEFLKTKLLLLLAAIKHTKVRVPSSNGASSGGASRSGNAIATSAAPTRPPTTPKPTIRIPNPTTTQKTTTTTKPTTTTLRTTTTTPSTTTKTTTPTTTTTTTTPTTTTTTPTTTTTTPTTTTTTPTTTTTTPTTTTTTPTTTTTTPTTTTTTPTTTTTTPTTTTTTPTTTTTTPTTTTTTPTTTTTTPTTTTTTPTTTATTPTTTTTTPTTITTTPTTTTTTPTTTTTTPTTTTTTPTTTTTISTTTPTTIPTTTQDPCKAIEDLDCTFDDGWCFWGQTMWRLGRLGTRTVAEYKGPMTFPPDPPLFLRSRSFTVTSKHQFTFEAFFPTKGVGDLLLYREDTVSGTWSQFGSVTSSAFSGSWVRFFFPIWPSANTIRIVIEPVQSTEAEIEVYIDNLTTIPDECVAG